MASAGYDIAKAGWLYRQSSVLHRWKRNWFVLDRDGDLHYFDSPDNPKAENRLVIRAIVLEIKTGLNCRKVDLPDGGHLGKTCLLELVMRDKESMLLCAESEDDMRAWQIALEEARTLHSYRVQHGVPMASTTMITPPGYVLYGNPPFTGYGYPGHVISQHPAAQVIHSPQGTTTVVTAPQGQQVVYLDDGPYRYRRYYRGGVYPTPVFFW